MRLSLQSYFDLGHSLGLGDEAFRSRTGPVPDIRSIGIRNPLGEGVVCDLKAFAPDIVAMWREKAKEKVIDPDTELGYVHANNTAPGENDKAFGRFKNDLIVLLDNHPIERCELTLYAIGTVFVRLDLASGIPIKFMHACRECYEYAAYLVDVSGALQGIAVRTAKREQQEQDQQSLKELSRRSSMEIQRDARGYQQATLFTAFTCVALCVDRDDDIAGILEQFNENEADHLQTLNFAYHGKLHFGWSACVLEPRTIGSTPEAAFVEIARMLECIQIAHVFLGTCQAFEKLFSQETRQQTERYVKGRTGRKWRDLNRLRTLALAVVDLTNYGSVTMADEDQAFFKYWEQHAHIESRQSRIQEQCELLYNVQDAEADNERANRDWLLNRIILLLTILTSITVLTDSYQFVHYEQGWLAFWPHRLAILVSMLAALSVVFAILLRYLGRQ
jgi:hypothetical protein